MGSAGLQRTFRLIGAGLLPGTALLAGRLVYEQTIMTWWQGPQMVGFMLLHSPLALPFGAAALAAHLWLPAFICLLILGLVRGSRPGFPDVALALATLLCLGLLYVPYKRWCQVLVATAGPGPNGAKLLCWAAATDDFKTMSLLLGAGVPADAESGDNETPLICTGDGGHLEAARVLLERGAAINRQGRKERRTVLMEAARFNHTDLVRFLLQKGADARMADSEGRTALDLARLEKAADTVRLLAASQ